MENEQKKYIHPDRAAFLRNKFQKNEKGILLGYKSNNEYVIPLEGTRYDVVISDHDIKADAQVVSYLFSFVENIKIIDYSTLHNIPIYHLDLNAGVRMKLEMYGFSSIGEIISVINTENGEAVLLSKPDFWLDSLLELIKALIEYGVSTVKFARSFDRYLLVAMGEKAFLATGFPKESLAYIENQSEPTKPEMVKKKAKLRLPK